MPTPSEATDELSDIVVRLVGCEPEAVTAEASLKDLGIDSLLVVEMAEEAGRRFDVYLCDDSINGWSTVGDVVDAVVHHDGSTMPAARTLVAAPVSDAGSANTGGSANQDRPTESLAQRALGHPRRNAALRALGLVAFIGAALGIVLGMGGAAIVAAAGINDADLPPLTAAPTPEPTETTPSPEPTKTATKPEEPKPTLEAEKKRVPPGERFALTGAIPKLGSGAALQVQVKDPGTGWDDFPVETRTREGGTFRTVIYTSRTGDRKFRLLHKKSNTPTPEVTVTIG